MSSIAATSPEGTAVARGRLLVLLAGLFWSSGGLLVRLVEAAGPWEILFWRSLSLALFLLPVIALRDQGRLAPAFRAAGTRSLLGGAFLALAFVGFILSVTLTTVANVMFMLAASPLLAAALGWVVLREGVRRSTWAAIAVAMVGMGLMVGDGLSQGAPLGDFLALASAFGFACYTVTLRSRQTVDMLPSVVHAGWIAALAGAAMVLLGGGSLAVTGWDLSLCVLLGVAQLGCGLVVYTLGARRLPAAECVLLTMAEVVLGPLWVWLAIGEVPSGATLLGGAVMLAAIAFYALTGLRRRRPPIGVV